TRRRSASDRTRGPLPRGRWRQRWRRCSVKTIAPRRPRPPSRSKSRLGSTGPERIAGEPAGCLAAEATGFPRNGRPPAQAGDSRCIEISPAFECLAGATPRLGESSALTAGGAGVQAKVAGSVRGKRAMVRTAHLLTSSLLTTALLVNWALPSVTFG